MLKPLSSLFEEFETALKFKNDLEKKAIVQKETARINDISRRQQRSVKNAVSQLLAIEGLELKIQITDFLLKPGKIQKMMADWNSAKTNLDVHLAEKFFNDCEEWSVDVVKRVSKSWNDECEALISRCKSVEQFLTSLTKFDEFEIDNKTHLERLNSYLNRSPSAIPHELLEETKVHILRMEKKFYDLDPPSGFNEFLKRIQSSYGYPLIEFNKPENSEIRAWMDVNNITANLTLKLMA